MQGAFVQFLQDVENTGIATIVRESTWIFPTIETIHVMAISLVVGTIWIADLRIMGFASNNLSIGRVLNSTLPATWACFLIAVITGVLMFMSSAKLYGENPALQIKMLLLLLAGANMLAFHWYTRKGLQEWDSVAFPPTYMRTAGAISMLFWICVVAAGRWIAF